MNFQDSSRITAWKERQKKQVFGFAVDILLGERLQPLPAGLLEVIWLLPSGSNIPKLGCTPTVLGIATERVIMLTLKSVVARCCVAKKHVHVHIQHIYFV